MANNNIIAIHLYDSSYAHVNMHIIMYHSMQWCSIYSYITQLNHNSILPLIQEVIKGIPKNDRGSYVVSIVNWCSFYPVHYYPCSAIL